MTRDDIIRMAWEAGMHRDGDVWYSPFEPEESDVTTDDLAKFAALVAAAEREVCAKVAESYEPRCDTCPSGVANAIRARGQA